MVTSDEPGPDTVIDANVGLGSTNSVIGDPGISWPCMEDATMTYDPDRVYVNINVVESAAADIGTSPERTAL